MNKVFLSYHFDAAIVPLINNLKRLIKSHDLEIVDGQRLAGHQLTQGVKDIIRSCDVMVIVLTIREGGKSNDWVSHERTTAYTLEMPFIALIEEGIDNNGPFSNFEYIRFARTDISETLLKLSETLLMWKLNLGEQVEAYVEPDKVANAVRQNINMDEIVRYRFFTRKNGWGPWKIANIMPRPAGVSLLLNGVLRDSEIQVQVRTPDNTWHSDLVNRNLRVFIPSGT